jgi:protein-tyrosine phosphatase
MGDNPVVPLRVLFVCTGNVCRSPMGELFFATCAAPGAVEVSSAGVAALVGDPIDTSSARVLADLGLDPNRHRARQFEPAMATEADLVLTAERSHRDDVIAAAPATFRHVFTMKEFARLVQHAGPGEPREVIRRAADLRAVVGPVPAEDDDVPDGYRLDVPAVTAIARQIARAVKEAADVLAPRPPARRPRPYARPRPAPPAEPLRGKSTA